MVLIYVIHLITMKYAISYSGICSEQKMVYSWLCFIDQTPGQLPNTALNIYSPLNHNHDIKDAFMSHSVQVLQHAHF